MAIMPLFKRCFEDTQSTFLGAKMPSKHQFICLNVIYMFQPITMGDLARQIGVSRQQLQKGLFGAYKRQRRETHIFP